MGNESSSQSLRGNSADIDAAQRWLEGLALSIEHATPGHPWLSPGARRERTLENERKQKEIAEKQRIEQEKIQEEERRRAEYQQQRDQEIAKEEARRRKEEEKRLRLEKELSLRRAELFKYKFGNNTGLDSFRGLPIDDVTRLRIGVFGATGSGKSCFINTCERTVRETEKGSAPDSTTGQEGTITLQEYLPELFFRLIDTRGFFNYNANETVEFQNILYGKLQPGDNVIRPPGGRGSATAMDLHPCPAFANRLHGVIFVFMANDPRLWAGAFKDYLIPFRDILRKTGIAPITVVTHRDRLKTEEECNEALHKASAATGSALQNTFLVTNYTRDDSNRSPEKESLIFDILHYALMLAERAVKIMKHQQKNKEEDEGTTITEKVAPDSAEAPVEIFLRHLQKKYQWSTNGLITVLKKLSDDEVTSVRLLAMWWRDVQAHFPYGMERMVGKELRTRNMIP